MQSEHLSFGGGDGDVDGEHVVELKLALLEVLLELLAGVQREPRAVVLLGVALLHLVGGPALDRLALERGDRLVHRLSDRRVLHTTQDT